MFSFPVAYTPTVSHSTTLLSMVTSFNTLLDSGCTRHVVRDRALFHDYAEESISVGTATCGSLDALGSGDVKFRYPFGDRYVIFTLRGCLYAPMAPMNLLSVGALVERGMSCLFSLGGITKVFFPDQHPKLPGLAFSTTVANHLSFLLLDFIPPVASSVPVAFPAWVSPPAAVPPSQSAFFPSSSPSSHRKLRSPPKKKLPPHYLVIDTTLPSHIFSDRSLFKTYTPSRRLHRTVFGTDIIIEGIGDVEVRIVVSGKSILFRLRDSWHVPSSQHHFLSCSKVISLGNQIMIAGRSPQLIFSHKKRLVEPNFPKYMPFKQVDHFIVLEFDIPTQVSLSPLSTNTTTTQPTAQSAPTPPSFSLQASSSCFPFAGLTFNQSLFPPPRPHADVVPDTSEVVASGLHGGADVHSVAVSTDGIMNLGVNNHWQAVASRPTTCGGDLDDGAQADLFILNLSRRFSRGAPFAFEDTVLRPFSTPCLATNDDESEFSSSLFASMRKLPATFPASSHNFSFSNPFSFLFLEPHGSSSESAVQVFLLYSEFSSFLITIFSRTVNLSHPGPIPPHLYSASSKTLAIFSHAFACQLFSSSGIAVLIQLNFSFLQYSFSTLQFHN